jgi:hypothetical protein
METIEKEYEDYQKGVWRLSKRSMETIEKENGDYLKIVSKLPKNRAKGIFLQHAHLF